MNMENLDKTETEEENKNNEFSFEKKYENLPVIAIIGRPNVGKSTLFNRFLHKRRSITDPTPGVTRDPVEAQAIINGKPVLLVDTGGFKLTRSGNKFEDMMDELVKEKTIETLKKADRILLLLDAGLTTPEDEEFIRFLRPYFNKLIAAVNKTEGGRLTAEAYSYYVYGFKSLICISAEHGDNISELAEQLTAGLDFGNVKEAEAENIIRITLVGKPNTGKSTLANYLTNSDRSIISNVPGTTRDIVEGEFTYKDKRFIIQDTAGIRRKAKVNENIEYYSVVRSIKSMDNADIVFHLIDVQEGLTEQDKKIIDQASGRGLGIIFVLNKWDVMEQTQKAFKTEEEKIKVMFGKMEYAPVTAISANTGSGVKELLQIAIRMFNQLNKKIETSALNIALQDWLQAAPPPQGRQNSFTFKYMLQTKTRPVEFLLFANRPDAVTESYMRYIQNKIRKDLGFALIPILLKIKGSRKRWEERL
ncbi:ribosome biogenesis GTPase Der [Treponema pedis]|uniref:GTPase Der n=3 Tax=Treponema pedis TaxID=409322 RepID=S5ZQV0_9SPIR|nr:ribosome biogenesis GTPase Der [Treponema pedis]AGT45042.1 GTP-binding protein EngA [Treponema pedis str. T A4]QOW60306.1 ribosome biogenesis GTPase Der [Treponema pedis]